MANIKRRKAPKPEPKAVEPQDFVRLLRACNDDYEGTRNKALLLFLADTGARRGGLIGLALKDLNIDKRRASVIEKGKKKRVVYFSHYTSQMLRQWLSIRESWSDSVWVSVRTGDPLQHSGINQLIKRIKKRARVTGRVNPHAFRHGFARAFIEAGGDISVLAKLLGHSDLSTTANIYAVFSEDELLKFHDESDVLRRMLGEK